MAQELMYECDQVAMLGQYVLPDGVSKAPLALLFHDWSGCNDFIVRKAHVMAQLGYLACAVDMYGNGQSSTDNQVKQELMRPLVADRALLRRRSQAGLQAALALPMVDQAKVVVMGFCFGGLCAIDLLRSGAPISGVASFHGLLTPLPAALSVDPYSAAKLLILHGYDDPMVNNEDVQKLAQEMTNKGVDWQINIYGHTMHAFSNPMAHDAKMGTVYNQHIAERSWRSMVDFFQDIIADD